MTFSFRDFFLTTFLGDFWMTFFTDFFDELFLDKGGESLGLLNFQKCVFLTFETTFFAKKQNKNHFRKISSTLDIEGSILDTVKTHRDSAFEILDDRNSQPWF